MSRLVVVTATTNFERARPCIASWGDVPVIIVANAGRVPAGELKPPNSTWLIHDDYLGVVPAFKTGTDFVLDRMPDADVIACLHDDLRIDDPAWGEKVLRRFDQQPAVGLLGFGGAVGLGDADIYQKPYQPQQLARIGFRSNLVDAEVHGVRSLLAERVACLDGFSQVGSREFWLGHKRLATYRHSETEYAVTMEHGIEKDRPWHVLADLGFMHHFYDGALGCLAARYGWQTYYEPIRCQHLGGQTAVGDQGYQRWAQAQIAGGDHGFWQKAHELGYEAFRDILPLRV